MIYKVYILYAPDHDRLFTGMTTSLIDRMMIHNSDSPDEWTTAYSPWTLVHMELFDNESDALYRETFFESESGKRYVRENILPIFSF